MNNGINRKKEARLMKGNEALAEAAIRVGIDAYFGYPITPQSEILEYFTREMPKRGGTVLQAESELAAINMVYGGAGAGAGGTGRLQAAAVSPRMAQSAPTSRKRRMRFSSAVKFCRRADESR